MSSKDKKHSSVFTKMLINDKVPLDFKYVNKLLNENLLEYLIKKYEGKCCEQGYVKPNSIKLINYSSGVVKNNIVVFEVVFETMVCYLVEGMEINCIAKNITKAGIRAELDMDKTPAVIFIARDHHYTNKMFTDVQEGSIITVKIIGQRYELNDTNVSAIAELIKVNKSSKKIIIEDEEITTKQPETTDLNKIDMTKTISSKSDKIEENKSSVKDDKVEQKEATQEATPQATPEESQEATTQATTQATPEKTQEATTQATPDKTQEATTQATPEATQEATETDQYQDKDEKEELEALKALEELENLEKKTLEEKAQDNIVTIKSDKPKRGRPRKNQIQK